MKPIIILIIAFVVTQATTSLAQLRYIAPVGGHTLSQGSISLITWKAGSTASNEFLTISLWDGTMAKWITIATNVPEAQGSYKWAVPENLKGDRFRIRIDNGTTASVDMTPTFFSIQPQTTLAVSKTLPTKGYRSSLQVFPNPARERLSIAWKGKPAIVIVRNLLGTPLITKQVNVEEQSCTLETSALQSGAYLIEVQFVDGHEEKSTVIIQK